MTKGNDGRGARRILMRRLATVLGFFACLLTMIKLVLFLFVVENDDDEGYNNRSRGFVVGGLRRKRTFPRNNNNKKSRIKTKTIHVDLEKDKAMVDLILSASVHLVALQPERFDKKQEEETVYGEFCRVNFAPHKEDPSSVPMFRDLVGLHSPECDKVRYRANLEQVAALARQYDAEPQNRNRAMHIAGVAFHESRCGSTLVANALMAMDPQRHRVYSESAPPLAALVNICGETYTHCSQSDATRLLQDTMYLMSRTDRPQEETRVFFKIQSAGSRNMQVFLEAFPETPWIYVFREPVQVMMSHMAVHPESANCVRQRRRPPVSIVKLIKQKGIQRVEDLSNEEYCAAHLATLTESAVAAMQQSDRGVAVDYADLPDILYQDIIPNHFGIPVSEEARDRIIQVSQKYSKGRPGKQGEWREDSERKEERASLSIRQAALKFMQESYLALRGDRNDDDDNEGSDDEESSQDEDLAPQ